MDRELQFSLTGDITMGSKNKKFEPTKEQLDYILGCVINKTKTVSELSKEVGFGKTAIYALLKRNGVKLVATKDIKALGIKNYNQKYTYDLDFLDFLNSKGYCVEHISQITGIPYGNLNAFYVANKIKRNRVTDNLTPNQFEMIIDKYNSGMTIEDASAGFDINYKTLTYWLKKFNVTLRTSREYVRERKIATMSELGGDIVSVYLSGKSMLDTAKIFSVDPKRVDEIITERGVKRTKSESCHKAHGSSYNISAFADFNDESAAYFYGFILADGNIDRSMKTVSVTMNTKDSYILEKLSEYLGTGRQVLNSKPYDKRTGKTYNRSSFGFVNELIVSRLVEQGLSPAKSGKEVLPKFDWLHNRNFWRGVIDGDGWVRVKESTIGVVCSLEIVNGFLAFIENNIGLITKRTPLVINGKTTNYARVSLTGQDGRNAMQLLYQDAKMYLPRKYEEASKFFK